MPCTPRRVAALRELQLVVLFENNGRDETKCRGVNGEDAHDAGPALDLGVDPREGRSGFKSDLMSAGLLYKHSRPYHPQTCGKVERWHCTLIYEPHWRVRSDTGDVRGHVTLRYLGKLRHLNVGWAYRGRSIRLFILDDVVTFATDDGEFIGETRLEPTRDYQPKGHGFR